MYRHQHGSLSGTDIIRFILSGERHLSDEIAVGDGGDIDGNTQTQTATASTETGFGIKRRVRPQVGLPSVPLISIAGTLNVAVRANTARPAAGVVWGVLHLE